MPRYNEQDSEEVQQRKAESNERRSLLYNVVGGTLIAGCCWSLGYGYSQSTLGSTVAKVSLSIEHLRELQITDRRTLDEADNRLSAALAEQRQNTAEHMRHVVSLMTKMTEQNQELIAFLRAKVTTN
jgi:cyclopropane fatty-acyl-phospholipid synthase-like methyltransferase